MRIICLEFKYLVFESREKRILEEREREREREKELWECGSQPRTYKLKAGVFYSYFYSEELIFYQTQEFNHSFCRTWTSVI